MRTQWNREKALFFLAAVLFVWVMAKLGLFLSQRADRPATARTAAPRIHQGDPRIRDLLAVPPLDRDLPGSIPFGGPHKALAQRNDDGQARPKPDDVAEQEAENEKGGGRGEDEQGGEGPGGATDDGGKGTQKLVVDDTREAIPSSPALPPHLKLVGIVRTKGPLPRLVAVLRDEKTGRLHRMSIGDILLEELRLDDIRDDSVTLVDAEGTRHVFRGRFEVAYGH
jgi:hypothetical protein